MYCDLPSTFCMDDFVIHKSKYGSHIVSNICLDFGVDINMNDLNQPFLPTQMFANPPHLIPFLLQLSLLFSHPLSLRFPL